MMAHGWRDTFQVSHPQADSPTWGVYGKRLSDHAAIMLDFELPG